VKKEDKQGWLEYAYVSANNMELVDKTMKNMPGIIVTCFTTYLLSMVALIIFGSNFPQLALIELKYTLNKYSAFCSGVASFYFLNCMNNASGLASAYICVKRILN
jgi:hypothetical protein